MKGLDDLLAKSGYGASNVVPFVQPNQGMGSPMMSNPFTAAVARPQPVEYQLDESLPGFTDPNLPGFTFPEAIETEFNEQAEAPDFNANLVDFVEEGYLSGLASELLGRVEEDVEAMSPWMEKINYVREQIGYADNSQFEEPFPGASSVVYPMITKAQVQFQSRALPEIYPNDPVNSVVLGFSTPERESQAKRVRETMNYQITYEDRGNKEDFRRMCWWLPLTGSTFRRVFHDPISNKNMVRMVRVEDMIVPYNACSLLEAPQFAHRIFEPHNVVLKLQKMGFYCDYDLPEPDGDTLDLAENSVQALRDEVDGKMRTASSNMSYLHEMFDVYVDLDLPGFEEVDEDGEETGISLPYVVTVHKSSNCILAIRRNWHEDDALKLKRIYFSHYKYMEGPGFYGSGLPHVIGSLQQASTGALRAFSDSLAFSLLPGGWKSEDARFSGSSVFGPGMFQDVQMTQDDINKAIKIAQFPAPPPIALEYITMLDNQAQAIVSTMDIMTGNQTPVGAPVGTTLAIIEQAQKVITAQHQSLHESFSNELMILFDLNYDFLPEDEIFYAPGTEGRIRRADFDEKVAVVPTADPSVASFQQRQAIDQACWQLFQQAPQYFSEGGYPILERILSNMKVPAVDQLLKPEQQFMQEMQQQQQQPSPDQLKMQFAQQELQAKQQSEQATLQAKQQDSQVKMQIEQLKGTIAQQKADLDSANQKMELQLREKEMDMNAVLKDKEIDARYAVTSSTTQELFEATDKAALDTVQKPKQPLFNIPQENTPPEQGRNFLKGLMGRIRGK